MLTVIDEFTRECLAIEVARRLRSDDVLQVLAELFVQHGPPDHIRSDNGSEFTAKAVRDWLSRVGVETLYIEPGSCRAQKLNLRRFPQTCQREMFLPREFVAGG